MKMKSLLVVAAAAIGCSAFATNYTWTGDAGDGLWTSPRNWDLNVGYPSNADDEVTFAKSGDVNVSLDTGSQTDVAYINVTAGNVVLTATEGSSLKINWTGNGYPADKPNWGITVADGASLDFAVPLATIDGRFDKYGTGKLIFRDVTFTKTGSPNWYLYNGTNSFEGSSSVTLASNSDIVFGVGTPVDRSFAFIKDNVHFSVCCLNLTSGGDVVPNSQVIQDGAGTVIAASTKLRLDCNSANDAHCYTLKSGSLSAGELSVAPSYYSPNTGGGLYTSPDYSSEHLHYIQEGGTSTFAKVTLTRGSAALRGGVMNYTGADADFKFGVGTKFEMAGGTLSWPREFSPASFPSIKWSGTSCVTVPSGKAFTWNWQNVNVASGTVLKYDGNGTLTFDFERFTSGVGLEIAAGKTVTIASGATVLASPGSTEPWKVTLNNGSILKLTDTSSRLFAPLDLTVNGTGKIQFLNNVRGAVVAHKLTVDGVAKARGKYLASNSFVDGLAAASILVPTVWTGNGGNNLWSNPDNWDDGVVPNSSTAVADISSATSVTLDTDVSLTSLIVNPNRADRTVTLSGNGKLTLYTASEYDNGLFVPKGCELVVDVNFKRGNNTVQGLFGGGKVTFKKDVAICKSSGGIIWSVDGTLALNGATISPFSGSTIYLNFWSQNGANGQVLIEDGSISAATRVWQSISGYTPLYAIRQTGGTVAITDMWLSCYYSNVAEKNSYILDGGDLTVANAIWFAPGTSVSGTLRYPGGSFEMSGGTLTCGGFKSGKNQNYARLYGGIINLKGNMEAQVYNPEKIGNIITNEISYYLGGVTICPTGGQRDLVSGNAYLTGKNGDVKFDLSERDFSFSSGNTISGPGGIVVSGGSGRKLYSSAAFTFTGAMTVKSGGINFYEASTVNGPSALFVENADSSVYFGNGAAKAFDRIVLVQSSNLSVGQNKTVTTKRLVVGGTDVVAGTYTGVYGSGTVVVTGSTPASWVVEGAGDLSWFPDGTTTAVDAATTLSSLTYVPATAGATNTLTGAALTFADGANIYVEKGDTLVIGNNVVFAGKVTKTGWGEVVFNGGVTCSGTPAADNDTGWLTVQEGGATFDGAVTGVRLVTCGVKDASGIPVITLKENCTVSNYAIVLTAWSEGNAVANVTGETHQQGANVNYSAGIFANLINASNIPLSKPNGGVGRYVLDSGTLTMSSSLHTSFFNVWNDTGTFELVQNGGTFIQPLNLYLVRNNKGVSNTYTINGGRVEFGAVLTSYSRTMGFVNFNGGTVKIGYSGAAFCPRENFVLTVSGTVAFEVPEGTSAIIANDGAGEASFVKTGAGSLKLDGAFDLLGLDVQGGTLTLTDKTLLLLDGTADLSIAKTSATLNLDYEGEAAFKTLKVGEISRGAGVYSATDGATIVKKHLSGTGSLRILEGSDPGIIIRIR